MAAAKIIVVEKNEGEKIAYDVSTTKIIFGDDDLMVNIKNRERDEEVTLDICKDTQDGLTVKSKEAFNRVLETVTAWTSITKRMFKFKFAFKSDNL